MKKKDIIENILFSIVNNEKYVNLYENIYLITDTSTIFFGYITAIETEHNGGINSDEFIGPLFKKSILNKLKEIKNILNENSIDHKFNYLFE